MCRGSSLPFALPNPGAIANTAGAAGLSLSDSRAMIKLERQERGGEQGRVQAAQPHLGRALMTRAAACRVPWVLPGCVHLSKVPRGAEGCAG